MAQFWYSRHLRSRQGRHFVDMFSLAINNELPFEVLGACLGIPRGGETVDRTERLDVRHRRMVLLGELLWTMRGCA